MMIDKKKLLEELKKTFEEEQQEFGFSSTSEDINDIIFLEDLILSQGYVSPNNFSEVKNKIIETFYNWVGVFHSWIMPNPQDLIFLNEAKKLNEDEKKEVFNIIK